MVGGVLNYVIATTYTRSSVNPDLSMNLTVNLVNVPVFFSWQTAQNRNFYSKTEWRRRDFDVSAFDPDGLVVLETQKVRIPSAWQPALSIDGDFFIVASVWFDVFSSDLVSGVSSSNVCPTETVSVSLPSMKNHRLSRTLADCQSSSVFDSKSERDLKSENLSDSNPSSISSIKKNEEGGGEKEVDTIRWKEFPDIDQTSSKQKTSEVNNFREPRKRQNNNHPCWIPTEYPLEQTPVELRDSLLKLSNLVFLYSQSQPDPDDFVSLKKEYLRNQFGKQTTDELINFALQTELLESDNQYTIGQKAKGYRFTERFRNHPHRIINCQRSKRDQANSDKLMKRERNKHIRYLWEHLIRLTVNKRKLEAYSYDWQIFEPCLSILNGNFYLTQDDFGGRWYSNLTNLKREARGLLRIEGKSESLWEIDIKNSQPLFASIAAQKAGFHDEGFSTLCEQGVLYEALMSSWGVSDRDAVKKELLKIFYSKNGYRSEEKSKFESQFPTFSEFMEKAKKLNHKHFANLMQTTERKFIVDSVVPELIRQSPGIFIATIHDSLLVEKRRAEFAHDVLSGLFMGKYGVSPMTHMKDTGDYLR